MIESLKLACGESQMRFIFVRLHALPSVGFLVILTALLALTSCSGNDKSTADVVIPDYTVLEVVNQFNGDRIGDVLIPTLDRKTPVSRRADIVKEIARREKFTSVNLYCSRDAFSANFSSSFAEEHPDALRTCLLGTLLGAEFIPGESVFP